jgi:CBS domain-containing protein
MTVDVVHLHSPVSCLVRRPAAHISQDSTLREACRVMRSENTSAVLVGPGRGAILTERDLTRAVAAEYTLDSPVAEVATPLPVSVPAQTDILEAAALMLNHEVRHLVVEEEDDSLGIVSLRQIMAVLLQAAKPEIWLTSLRLRLEMPRSEMWLG